ncbi:hypothetical protein SAMN06297280_1842 [Arsukibacterium tuosuense]|uniref:Uncharacterized protein n=1 Tax=Arsukibacterium tuosuense TaxID=1323745 RepID=A0A285ITQ8_9GAMM|nr:hypothetical protein [Arsukibacterium tuosuense]SNY51410.1 hypothetical protein SAMN06297280_1842 [Arsukibacterium tuosuense]
MRWFSSFAILVYLSLLCSPQAMAVHDSRLSPLADTQLQGLHPAINSALNQKTLVADDADDEPKVAIAVVNYGSYQLVLCTKPAAAYRTTSSCVAQTHQARAPPVFSSR